MHTRQNVFELGQPWADPILWYARGVAAMKAKPLADQGSWRFFASIHGFDRDLWEALGFFSASSDPLPSATVRKRYWKQCQHGSWYFLPWHRGFLLAFEATVRAAVVGLGGPTTWALPYWNYFKTGQASLPAEFAKDQWPDAGHNPLYVKQRYGPNNDGHVKVILSEVNLAALSDPDFSGVSGGGSPGFGGVDTGYSHSGQVHGGVETQPHDWVHGLVGGSDPDDPTLPGLMSDPDTAGLDPIFWLHHANIDRLWASWHHGPPVRHDPSATKWLGGPKSHGASRFALPMPGPVLWRFSPQDMLETTPLDYKYDDLSPTGAAHHASAVADRAMVAAPDGGGPVSARRAQLVGANDEVLTIRSASDSLVRSAARSGSFAADARGDAGGDAGGDARAAPDGRVFLNLENVTGQADSSAFQVYVGVPAGQDVTAHPELLAGSVSPFGLRKASQPDGDQAGQGLTFVFDITRIVATLGDPGSVGDLPVRIVPVRELAAAAQVHIGRISIYREA